MELATRILRLIYYFLMVIGTAFGLYQVVKADKWSKDLCNDISEKPAN